MDVVRKAAMSMNEPLPVADDLASALDGAGVRGRFDAMSPSHRREWLRAIDGAKKPPTRAKRIAKCVVAMRARADAARTGYVDRMDHDEQHPSPAEASREGLEALERAPHHQTTEHDKAPGGSRPGEIASTNELHRGGPFPDTKR